VIDANETWPISKQMSESLLSLAFVLSIVVMITVMKFLRQIYSLTKNRKFQLVGENMIRRFRVKRGPSTSSGHSGSEEPSGHSTQRVSDSMSSMRPSAWSRCDPTESSLFVNGFASLAHDERFSGARPFSASWRIRVNFGEFVGLVIQISNLSIPERLLALIPLGLILPKLLEKLRKARRSKYHDPRLRDPLR